MSIQPQVEVSTQQLGVIDLSAWRGLLKQQVLVSAGGDCFDGKVIFISGAAGMICLEITDNGDTCRCWYQVSKLELLDVLHAWPKFKS